MGSETSCCGGGLSGICLLIIHFIFQFLTTPTSNTFQCFPLNFYTFKKIRNIIQKFSKNSWTKDSNLIESFFDGMKCWLDIEEKGRKSTKNNSLDQTAPFNRPFPGSPGPLFQNEGRCSAFDMEIIFHSHANKTHFHKKGCALGLILKVRVFGTQKWPILFLDSRESHFLF